MTSIASFTLRGKIWCGLPPQVRYQTRIFRLGAVWNFCRHNRKCWVEMLFTRHQPVIPRNKNPLFVEFKSCSSSAHLLMNFSHYLLTPKHINPIQQHNQIPRLQLVGILNAGRIPSRITVLCPHYTCSRSCPDLRFCPDRKTTTIERDKRKRIPTWSCQGVCRS